MSHLLFALLSLLSFAALLEAQWKLRENGKKSICQSLENMFLYLCV